ncbi:hypothetical protein CBR_g51427 [Chara braunii]|uniref:DUF659 domain-containing protein n=1 Tax=Chara braunii TaxID=69332 RepID=A0A388K665_CHABU|nr:hypothetical protein CBR_g51427 [Chara braunii]|eukprot:GBG65544.1 hypothetical protein CBR_g51427 [Chara braunii]
MPATDPSLFVPQPEGRQMKLQGEKEVWKHVEQGQEAAPKGRGEYWLRCQLCSTVYRGTSTRAVEHFLKLQKPCPFRTGGILHKLVAQDAKVLPKDKKMQYLLQNYRQLHNISVGGAAITRDDENVVIPRGYEEPQPSVAAGREPVEEVVQRGKETAAVEAVREDGDSNKRVASLQQTIIKRWVDNTAQKKLDVAGAKTMFRAGIAFQYREFDTTQQLPNVYLEVANARPKVKLLFSKHMRTVMLEFIFMRIQKQVEPLTKCWDVTGCTFITDGSNDRRERPVMNFLAAGEQGAVLVVTVYMDGKKKTGAALVKGKTPWSETFSEGEAEDSSNDDFELGARPSISGTTYVGRRPTTRHRRERPPRTPSQGTANTSAQYNIQSDVELPKMDTDIDMVLRPGPIDADEAETDRAKAMVDADRERVQRRMREEERGAAIPTRREMEKQKKKVGEHEPEHVWEMGQQKEEEEEEMGQQDEEEEHEMTHESQEEEEMEDEEEKACMERREEEMEEDEGKGIN